MYTASSQYSLTIAPTVLTHRRNTGKLSTSLLSMYTQNINITLSPDVILILALSRNGSVNHQGASTGKLVAYTVVW